jgi:hypothetical protein
MTMELNLFNPYYDQVAPRLKRDHWGILQIEGFAAFNNRSDFTSQYSWAIPTAVAVKTLVEFSAGKILEIGAGTGYWAYLCSQLGADVTCFDLRYNNHRNEWGHRREWHPICHGTSTQARKSKYQHHTLFLCWPPYSHCMALKALNNFCGDRVAYIGEGIGGCTGTDKFHARLESRWELVHELTLPQWGGMHDQMFLYRRKQ